MAQRFNPVKRVDVTLLLKGSLGPKTSLEELERSKIPSRTENQTTTFVTFIL
jgi:hypothetical protein